MHREFDHTGDLGIEIEGDTAAAVFEEAAVAMFGLVTYLPVVEENQSIYIALTGDDRESLLLAWLSELNFLHLTDRLLFCRFSIEEIDETHIEAIAYGEQIDPDRHTIFTEIKAVTYHDMVVGQRGDRWYARVIFDM